MKAPKDSTNAMIALWFGITLGGLALCVTVDGFSIDALMWTVAIMVGVAVMHYVLPDDSVWY